MKNIITCFKLVRYGKKAKMNIILGIVFVGLFLIMFPLMLSDSEDMNLFPAFLLMEGTAFLTQPAMSLAQNGTLAPAPIRRFAEIYYQPLCLFLSAAAGEVYYMLVGAAAVTLDPQCAGAVVYHMLMTVCMMIMFIAIIGVLKMNLAGYIGMIFILIILLWLAMGALPGAVKVITGGLSPMGAVFAGGGVSLAGCALLGLAAMLLCRALYKKNYGKYVKQMLDMGM